MKETTRATEYEEGFADALRWVLDVFNFLDTEDVDELNRVLQGGDCEGKRPADDAAPRIP